MNFETAFWQAIGFAAPALCVPAFAAGLAKLLWFRALRGVSWWRLTWPTALVALVVLVGGLVGFGHDGKVATEGAMCLACAATLGWIGFRRG